MRFEKKKSSIKESEMRRKKIEKQDSDSEGEKRLPKTFKKVRVRRTVAAISDIDNIPKLDGILKDMNLDLIDKKPIDESSSSKTSKLISGLNKSLLKSINIVIEKQSDKDLKYIFEQYLKYLEEIKCQN